MSTTARPGPDVRVLVHALDRTGPPMLVRALVRWLAAHRPTTAIEVVAFRGGPIGAELEHPTPVHVVLRPHEPWDVRAPDGPRRAELSTSLAGLGPAAVNLLVSVAAAQVLPLLPEELGPVVTWSVEVGEDLRWLHEPTGVVERTDTWLAGSAATRAELLAVLPEGVPVEVVDEFVEDPRAHRADELADARREAGAVAGELLVVGAGIGTHRKGLDLFAEVAALASRQPGPSLRFAWFGGTDDPLHPLVAADLDRPGLGGLSLLPPVADLDRYLAAADVLLHPARRDAFPLVCVAAAAVGTPVVAFRGAGGIEEMLGEDLVGAPFPAVDELAGALVALADEAVRARVGEAQRARAARHLASAAVPRLVALLDRVAVAS